MSSSILRRVSLTGADDHTPVERLVELTCRFPFVEWAVLYTPHNEGAPRNPTAAWRERFFADLASHSAVHLCGSLAFEQLLAGSLAADLLGARRLQLNINARRVEFTDAQVLEVFARALDVCPAIILQYHEQSAPVIERYVAGLGAVDQGRVHVLMDASRGTGKAPDQWRWPSAFESAYVGFAGGLGPQNTAATVEVLRPFGRPFWVDMESGVRTDNRFDLHKAASVLDSCARFI